MAIFLSTSRPTRSLVNCTKQAYKITRPHAKGGLKYASRDTTTKCESLIRGSKPGKITNKEAASYHERHNKDENASGDAIRQWSTILMQVKLLNKMYDLSLVAVGL